MSPPAPRMCQTCAGRRAPRNEARPRWQSPHRYSLSGVKSQAPLADRPRPAVIIGPSCWRERSSRPRRRRSRGSSIAGRRCRLRCRVRRHRSIRRLARPDYSPNWCGRGNSTAGRGFTADVSAGAAATADDAGAPLTDAAEFGGCCRCPFDRENIGIFISFDWRHSSEAESEITAAGGERVPLGGCSPRWWRACKGGLPLSGGPGTLETGPPWQPLSTSRCACPCAMLCASPSGGPSRQASLLSQPKLQKGRGPCCCCGHTAVPSPPR